MPWVTAGTIYVLVHVEGNHWVIAVVFTLTRYVTAYDLLRSGRYHVIDHIAKLVLIILCKRVYDDLLAEYHSPMLFNVVYASFMPQQTNG